MLLLLLQSDFMYLFENNIKKKIIVFKKNSYCRILVVDFIVFFREYSWDYWRMFYMGRYEFNQLWTQKLYIQTLALNFEPDSVTFDHKLYPYPSFVFCFICCDGIVFCLMCNIIWLFNNKGTKENLTRNYGTSLGSWQLIHTHILSCKF